MKLYTFPIGELGTNCYVVIDEQSGEAAIIDPAWFLFKEMLDIVDDLAVKKVKYILLTHGHYDHICGVYDAKEYTGAEVAIHAADADCLFDPGKSMSDKSEYTQKPLRADLLLADGDVLELGGTRLRVLHTPGHTKGSVCFIEENERALFSGDTLFYRTAGRVDFPGSSKTELMDSLLRLKNLDGDYDVYPGHERKTTLEFERTRNFFMRRLGKLT